ncbi:MAG: sugar phosphate isomerase/epimerase [Actinobacteria bacterium]|nr:sugar phosphate isomerase/epimerase [Actinomycetota bacterium]
MKLGYTLWGMPDVPVGESIPRLAAMGYQGVELSVLPRWNTSLERLGPAERRLLRSVVATQGLELTAISAHGSLLDPVRHDDAAWRLRGAVDLAAELDPTRPPVVVTGSGGTPEQWDAVKQQLVDEFSTHCTYAGERGVTIAIEPHVGAAIDEPHEMRWLIERVPGLRINGDYSHFLGLGLSVADSMAPLTPWIVHTHVKGTRGRWPDHEFLTPGEDDFDYAAYLRAIRDAGYAGFSTVEVSVMVQRRPGYDPFAHARLGYHTLAAAFERAGIARA